MRVLRVKYGFFAIKQTNKNQRMMEEECDTLLSSACECMGAPTCTLTFMHSPHTTTYETTLWFYLTPVRMSVFKKTNNNKWCKDGNKNENGTSHAAGIRLLSSPRTVQHSCVGFVYLSERLQAKLSQRWLLISVYCSTIHNGCYETNAGIQQEGNRQGKCSVYTQWDFFLP